MLAEHVGKGVHHQARGSGLGAQDACGVGGTFEAHECRGTLGQDTFSGHLSRCNRDGDGLESGSAEIEIRGEQLIVLGR